MSEKEKPMSILAQAYKIVYEAEQKDLKALKVVSELDKQLELLKDLCNAHFKPKCEHCIFNFKNIDEEPCKDCFDNNKFIEKPKGKGDRDV